MANEKRLIYAHALESNISKMFVQYGDGTYPNDREAMIYDEALVEVLEALDTAPTVDAVEVVRCKDCKHAVVAVPPLVAEEKLVCTKSVNWRAVEAEHFCSYGERKDNG